MKVGGFDEPKILPIHHVVYVRIVDFISAKEEGSTGEVGRGAISVEGTETEVSIATLPS